MTTKKILRKMSEIIPNRLYLRIKYRQITGKHLRLNNPKTYCEKLQWLKIYDRRNEYTQMVDKYEVKQFVSERIGERYVIPLLGVWDNFDQIDFRSLPSQFVLKTTHDSGGLVICKDKTHFNCDEAKRKINGSLKRNYYKFGREWPYRNVKPRIIAEKYMEDESGGLQDYKVMCFGGEPKLIQLHKNRFVYQNGKRKNTQDFYNIEWEKTDIWQWCDNSEGIEPRPPFLDEMLELSRLLSQDIPQLRVDWYYVNGQLYLGELTFFDGSGFETFRPDKWNYIMGEWINLPSRKRN